jgi:hypothetical protein
VGIGVACGAGVGTGAGVTASGTGAIGRGLPWPVAAGDGLLAMVEVSLVAYHNAPSATTAATRRPRKTRPAARPPASGSRYIGRLRPNS